MCRGGGCGGVVPEAIFKKLEPILWYPSENLGLMGEGGGGGGGGVTKGAKEHAFC